MSAQACPGCGVVLPAVDGPTHAYMLSSPACWAAYGHLLAREYADPALFGAAHRLSVDAYALQHPGDPDDRRARQSVWIHFASLRAVLDRGLPMSAGTGMLKELAGKRFPPFPAPPAWRITAADVLAAPAERHTEEVARWALHALESWRLLLEP